MDPHRSLRLASQLQFLATADLLKGVERANRLGDGSRRENSAEHSWHVCLMAMVLAEHCDLDIDLGRVLQMLVVHDLVEVFAGDTQLYDEAAMAGKDEREEIAADRLFGMLPRDQDVLMRSLWREFENRETADAVFARAIDSFAPTWLHWECQPAPQSESLDAITILNRKRPLLQDCPELLLAMEQIVVSAQHRGLVR